MLRPTPQFNQISSCGLRSSRYRRGGVPHGQVVNIRRAADGKRSRRKEVVHEKEQKSAKNGSSQNISTDTKA